MYTKTYSDPCVYFKWFSDNKFIILLLYVDDMLILGQNKGIVFDEIFSPVVKMTSIRAILSIATRLDLEVEQLDVKTAFLDGDLEE